jgi:hypothetical protein
VCTSNSSHVTFFLKQQPGLYILDLTCEFGVVISVLCCLKCSLL